MTQFSGPQPSWTALAKSHYADYVTLLALAGVTLWSEFAVPFTKVSSKGLDKHLSECKPADPRANAATSCAHCLRQNLAQNCASCAYNGHCKNYQGAVSRKHKGIQELVIRILEW